MKKTKLPKKLVLTKKTVANLDFSQQRMIKGGYRITFYPCNTIFPSAIPEECP
ncbi:MAG: hypothetical protein GY757_49040 [bacterium]|nr:hypothetical protein [bacterium]